MTGPPGSDSGSVVAVIPARGGSKGVPRKNLLRVAGRSLVARAIASCADAPVVSRVVVTTDDPEIAEEAAGAGAEVVERPAELAGDDASSEDALLHVLEELERREGYRPDVLVFVQCTAPLLTAGDVDGAVRLLRDRGADAVFAAAPFHGFVWRDGDGGAVGVNHDEAAPRDRRQDRAQELLEAGSVYAVRVESFRRTRSRFAGLTLPYLIPAWRCIEIDDVDDARAAEALLRRPVDRARLLPERTRAVVLDFDGVLTDNRVTVHEDGSESVVCDRGDGMGIELLREAGIRLLVLSKEKNPVVRARCDKLGIPCLQGIDGKAEELRRWLEHEQIDPSETVYIGNDVNDVECLQTVACSVVVADAHPAAVAAAGIVLSARGGQGAVRELADLILEGRARRDASDT